MNDQPTHDQIKQAAAEIRTAYPVPWGDKPKAVDQGIREQNAAIRRQLEAWGLTWSTTNSYGSTVEGRHVWHTDRAGHGGMWGDNPVEVALHMRMYAEHADAQLDIVEDADCTIYHAMREREKAAEKQGRAIERKVAKVEAKYTDTTTEELLNAGPGEGMLF